MMSNRLSTALIGCGAVSQILYAPALVRLEREGLIDTVALVDPNLEQAANISKMLSTARQYQDVRDVFADRSIDLAIIAAPHRFHAGLTIDCLKRGVPVLCEKPMAPTTAECDRMIQAADEAGSLLAVGHFRRFFPSTKMVQKILDAGLLGAVRSFRFLDGENYSWPAQSVSPFKRAEAGGGVLIDIGAHTIDLLLWWLGDAAEVVYQDDAMGGVESNCRMHLKMLSGADGFVQLSRDCPLPNRYFIECEKGWMTYRCDVIDRIEWGLYGSNYSLNTEIRMITTPTRASTHKLGASVPGYYDCFADQLRNVVAAIHGIETLCVPGTEARKTVALIEKCYGSRKLLEMPWLDVIEVQHARELANA